MKRLRDWLVSKGLCAADAADADVQAAAAKAMADGTLSAGEYAGLTNEPNPMVKSLMDSISALAEQQKQTAELLRKLSEKPADKPIEKPADKPPTDTKADDPVADDVAPLFTTEHIMQEIAKSAQRGGLRTGHKGAWTEYSSTKSAAIFPDKTAKGRHPLAGRPVCDGSRPLEHASELERAASGAFVKWNLCCQMKDRLPPSLRMTQHDQELVDWALHEAKWGGEIGRAGQDSIGVNGRKLTAFERKALIDDAITGGLEAAPIFFDDQFILDPILHSELYPYVKVVPISRGRRIEAASFANVTVGWGGGDEDATDLFDTTSFVSAFDTTIHVVDGAVELGLDFLSDSPLPVMDIIRDQYSQKLLESLDEQICVGDGLQEPTGIMVASGTTSVAFGGANSVTNLEALLFAVAKRFKVASNAANFMFCSNETQYRRVRGLAVGSDDVRRVFGLTEEDYMLFGHRYAINESLGNTQTFAGVMSRYRMYRRLGITQRVETGGKELALKNLVLMTMRARFGGQPEDGAAFATCTTAPA